ncbi:MAG: CHASE2 domain-containing protein [Gammaproteobacteria bacterium]|nr:CHASE2 domain-containing protein [Gammaproteobacteria bacterium]
MRNPSLLVRLARVVLLPFALLSERLGNRFYIGLAIVVIAVALYSVSGGHAGGMKHQAYDLIMKNRFRLPPADPDLVLIDIDEASMAAMAPEYGRWPWPRSVMAELVEGLERHKPAAIVFDIAFSDLDVDHPEADRYFRDVIAEHPQTFSAMIRLNPDNDRLSELKLSRLPGAVPLSPNAPQDATVAAVVPYFLDVLNDRRLGTNTLYTDDDGIARKYHVYRDAYGWRLFSLPANVVAALGGELPERSDILLNWRGRPLSYKTVSFYTLYTDLQKQQGAAASSDFTGKIIVIGSTAPSLFDIKPTPVSQTHPGVEILLTAIDNLKNGDYLTELPQGIYLLITIIALVALAIAFLYNVDPVWLYTLFTMMQTAFLGVAYLFLNYSTWFVDLTVPFTAAVAYFFFARFYYRAMLWRRNGHPLFSAALDPGKTCQSLLVTCRFTGTDTAAQRRAANVLQREAGLTHYGVVAARPFAAAPLLNNLHADTMLFYWLVEPAQTRAALIDLQRMLLRSFSKLQAQGLTTAAQLVLHGFHFTVDTDGRWRQTGKAAVVQGLALSTQSSRHPLTTTPEFAELWASCGDLSVPELLQNAGWCTPTLG